MKLSKVFTFALILIQASPFFSSSGIAQIVAPEEMLKDHFDIDGFAGEYLFKVRYQNNKQGLGVGGFECGTGGYFEADGFRYWFSSLRDCWKAHDLAERFMKTHRFRVTFERGTGRILRFEVTAKKPKKDDSEKIADKLAEIRGLLANMAGPPEQIQKAAESLDKAIFLLKEENPKQAQIPVATSPK